MLVEGVIVSSKQFDDTIKKVLFHASEETPKLTEDNITEALLDLPKQVFTYNTVGKVVVDISDVSTIV